MILELQDVSIGTDPGAALPRIAGLAKPGVPGVIEVETEQAPVLASLVAGGRMHPDAGRVLVDGVVDAARLRHSVALVDTPGVAEPFPVMSLGRIVREELAFAGQRANRAAVDTVLGELGIAEYATTPVQRVPTASRVRLLTELALLRPGVEALVVTSPERHGGQVRDWFSVLEALADRGIAVLLITTGSALGEIERRVAERRAETAVTAERKAHDGGEPSLQKETAL